MKVCRIGISEWSRASARTSSRGGVTSSSAGSATTAIQLLQRVGQGQAPRGEQHGEVVEHVGRLLPHALAGLVAGRPRDLVGLLADLLADARRIGKQRSGVAALGALGAALRDRA